MEEKRLKVGVISPDKNEWHVKKVLRELQLRGVEAYAFPISQIVSRIGYPPLTSVRGHSLDDYDALIIRRLPPGSTEQVFYRMDILHRLEDKGIIVVNPSDGIERAVDKFYTSSILHEAGLNTPRTLVAEGIRSALRGFEELGGDVIVKPVFGSLGKGITRVNDPDVAYRVFRALENIGSVFYLQEFIPHGNRDIRAFVIGDEVVAGMVRTAEGWKTNISAGGKPEKFELSGEVEELSVEANRAVGLEYSGVDIMFSEKDGGPYIIEVNSTPGWRGLQTVTENNIACLLVDFIYAKLTE
jgi:ribosomal protein S6--L-glutamate ligase/tetrahydromethanopterin:alpha-L-glutamate ligase